MHPMVRIVDLDALGRNIQRIRSRIPEGTGLMAVVKADAYGHGSIPCARRVLREGASALCVATIEEGLELRRAGLTPMILVLGVSHGRDVLRAGAEAGLTLTVCDPDHVLEIRHAAEGLDGPVSVHLKLDTGMNRLGVSSPEARDCVVHAIQETQGLVLLKGAYSHFADADGPSIHSSMDQLDLFRKLLRGLPAGILRHIANSAAIERLMPEAAFDMVRAGISMYGYSPTGLERHLEMVMTWETEITFIKDLPAGARIGYGLTCTLSRSATVATVRCGYGDGYHRLSGEHAHVLVKGKKCPVLGRICMDQMMVDVTGLNVRAGERVILMGAESGEKIDAQDLADWACTIPYEVLLSATGRVPRVWKGKE